MLRLFQFDPIEVAPKRRGYVTEKLEGRIFVEGRFVSTEEQACSLEQLYEHNIDPSGK